MYLQQNCNNKVIDASNNNIGQFKNGFECIVEQNKLYK